MPIDVTAIAREIEAGLPNERKRLDGALKNLRFYRGDFEGYTTRVDNGEWEDPRFERLSLIMQRVVNTLAQHLYAKGPAREFPAAPELTEWLQAQYHREGIDGKLQEAERLSLAADFAAVQVVGTGDPDKPVRFLLWSADQLVVWVDPEDPTRPAAVATIDLFDEQRRLRLWTDETLCYYATDKLLPGQTAGGVAYKYQRQEPNSYGCVPFAFFHAVEPSTQFCIPGPGTPLRKCNDWINFALTDVADGLRLCIHPLLKALGLGAYRFKTPTKPGDILYLPPGTDASGVGPQPSVEWLQPDGSFVEYSWSDLQSFIDHILECLGIPTATFRMTDASAKSGVAIVAEQLPLILHAQAKQRPFGTYERQLARVTILVAAAELARLGVAVPPFLVGATADELTLRWPAMVPDVPMVGSEAAAADETDLGMGLVSLTQIVMRRFNLSREQAIGYLKQVAADRAEEKSLGLGPVVPPPVTQPAAAAEATDAQSESESESDQ